MLRLPLLDLTAGTRGVITLGLLLLLSPGPGGRLLGDAAQCVQVYPCACLFDDGSGVIDITSLGNSDGTPRFDKIVGGDFYYYSYNPCKPFTQLKCKDAAVCQINADSSASYQAGDANTESWSFDGSDVQVYYNSMTETYRQTYVTLRCDPMADTPKIQALGETGTAVYKLILTTKCACKNGCQGGQIIIDVEVSVSTGSILLIIFFSLLFVYFVAGSVINKYQRQRAGAEIVPNSSFWLALPGLVKDGFGFTFGKVRGKKSGYDQV